MNCQEIREHLVDLVYDELAEPQRAQVSAHLDACDACRDELKRLRRARSALATYRSGEPSTMSVLQGHLTGEAGVERMRSGLPRAIRRPWLWRVLAAGAGVAAAILIGWALLKGPQGVLNLPNIVPIAEGATGPVEIRKVNLSLTILSAPENVSVGQFEMAQTAEPQRAYQSVNNSYSGQTMLRRGVWQGLALVRDQRLAVNLRKGVNEVRFKDVPAGIQPDTVRLRSLDNPGGLTILEQNYQFDLASSYAILKKHIDKPVTIKVQDLAPVTGDLLSFDGRTLVVRPTGEGPRSVSREKAQAITFEKLPEGLLTTPALVWRLDNQADQRQQFEVAYMTKGLMWRADYVLKLRPAARGEAPPKPAPPAGDAAGAPAPPIPDILDIAEMVGYATVSNRSGVTFENAQLKLMAGDVNLIQPEADLMRNYGMSLAQEKLGVEKGEAQFEEKSFFEYHLYTLGRPTTLRNAETKQIELVTGSGIKLKRAYAYDPQVNGTAARVVSEFRNSKENHLGVPLPKGVIRLYAPDAEGVQTFVAHTQIDHTPSDEKVRLPWGFAFDIACTARTTDSRRFGDEYSETREYDIRNHKDYGVTVTAVFRFPRTVYEADCKVNGKPHPWHIRQVGLVEVEVPVPANASVKVTFSLKGNNKAGGGLASPYDR